MALIHGRSAEGEEVKSTNPVLIGAKDINGNAILLTTDAEGKLRVATDLEIATDVTIHDPTTPGNKLKINADGSLPVQLSGSNIPKSGQKNVTTAGTQVALGATQVYKELTVIAKSTNTGNIYVGDSTVGSATGAILPAGGFITFHFVDIAAVYIDSDVNGEGVSFGGDV